ncbi:MAG: hypothetical protein JSW11_11950 [Candidatus Heimdallarchaeota archaeon]|nr:MAG: hypothetical protein JSW11_11950 [Candidatus Heimdallarchaeota archaeon]
MALNQILSYNILLHVIFSSISGLLLCVAGGVVLSRDRSARLNKMFLGFFTGIGLHQVFDGIMTYFLFGLEDINNANIVRELSIVTLILGLSFGSLVALNLYYKETLFTSTKLLIWGSLTVLLIIFGIFGDYVTLVETGGYGYGDHEPGKIRELFGWIGITGSILIFSGIIVVFLFLLIREVVDTRVQRKIIGITVGFILINLVVFFFDISFAFAPFSAVIAQPILHFLIHLIALLGVIITITVLWSPMSSASS